MKYLPNVLLVATVATAIAAAAGIRTTPTDAPDTPRCDAPAQRSIAELRRTGPDALRALLDQYDQRPEPRLLADIDAVAAQRDAIWSRLYWYTDLEKASAAARAQHKPILYLRLMGKLTDEYSCANSRFFRTVLYSNAGVSKLLRERFILVWASERPVPVVTIDYGDGRVLKRTVTGNSAHYVLDAEGRVVDVLPGLFDPVTFTQIVSAAADAAAVSTSDELRRDYARRAGATLAIQWRRDTSSPAATALTLRTPAPAPAAAAPNAAEAGARAISKLGVELPIIRALSPEAVASLGRAIDTADAATWQRVTTAYAANATLDERSLAMIRAQDPAAYAQPGELERTVEQFQRTIAQDTVRNQYQLRREVLRWLGEAPAAISLENLNARIYAELFLTPASDPWLGLKPADTYSALTNDGCEVHAAR